MSPFSICIMLALPGVAMAFFAVEQATSAPVLPSNNPAGMVASHTTIEQRCSSAGFDREKLMDKPEVQAVAYRMFSESFAFPRERAVWVTYKNGEFGFVHWPFPGGPNRAAWKGPVPECAVAILHTHLANESSEPCPADHELADGRQAPGIRLPVYVLHRYGITKAVPGNPESMKVRSLGWVNDFSPRHRHASSSLASPRQR